jgi:hypothetical protein
MEQNFWRPLERGCGRKKEQQFRHLREPERGMGRILHYQRCGETRKSKKKIHKKTEVKGKKKEPEIIGVRKKSKKKKTAFSNYQN